MLFGQVQRYPEAQHRPGGLGHKRGNGDPVETFILRDGFECGKEGLFHRWRFVILLDVLQLAFAEVGVLFRVLIEGPPQHHPQQGQRAGKHKRPLPAEGSVGEVDDRRGEHCADREPDASPAGGNWPFRLREPLADGLGVGRGGGRLGPAHKEAQYRQVQPAAGPGVGDTGQRPQGGADHKPELQADDVDKPATERLENRVSQLKRADDPGILFGGNAERRFQFRGDNPQRVACDVVDGDAK